MNNRMRNTREVVHCTNDLFYGVMLLSCIFFLKNELPVAPVVEPSKIANFGECRDFFTRVELIIHSGGGKFRVVIIGWRHPAYDYSH